MLGDLLISYMNFFGQKLCTIPIDDVKALLIY